MPPVQRFALEGDPFVPAEVPAHVEALRDVATVALGPTGRLIGGGGVQASIRAQVRHVEVLLDEQRSLVRAVRASQEELLAMMGAIRDALELLREVFPWGHFIRGTLPRGAPGGEGGSAARTRRGDGGSRRRHGSRGEAE